MEIVSVFSCGECGFDNTTMDNAAISDAIAAQARKFRAPLTRFLPGEDGNSILRQRPSPDVWSALEYARHQLDAIGWYNDRIELVLRDDRPQLLARDFTIAPPVDDVDPAALADDIGLAATAAADKLRSLTAEQWERAGIGSADGGARDVRILASRLAHEGHHHLLDIGRSLRAAREA